MKTTIYGLLNELTEIRYVGKTKHALTHRLRSHINGSKNKASHKDRWIDSMLPNKPSIKKIAQVDGDGSEAEMFYIAYYRMLGAKLTNETNGGEGGGAMLGRHHSEESKKKMSIARIGKPLTEAHKKKLSECERKNRTVPAWNKGKALTNDHKLAISAVTSGNKNPMYGKPGTMLGRHHTEETRKKMRIARARRNHATSQTLHETL